VHAGFGIAARPAQCAGGDEVGLGLAEAVTGLGVDVERLLHLVDGRLGFAPAQERGGEDGGGLALEEPVPAHARRGERLTGQVGSDAELADAEVVAGQPGHHVDLEVAVADVAGELEGPLVVAADGPAQVAAGEVCAGQCGQGVALQRSVVDLAGDQERGLGVAERLELVTQIAVRVAEGAFDTRGRGDHRPRGARCSPGRAPRWRR